MAEKSPNIKLAELIHSCPRLLGYGGLFGCLREDHSRFGLFAAFVNHAIAQKKFSPAYITTANFIAFIRDRELLEEGALNELEKFLEELRHGDRAEIMEEDSNRSQNTFYLLANTLGELGVWRNSAQSVARYEGALENAILSSAANLNANVPEISPVKNRIFAEKKFPSTQQTATQTAVGGQPGGELALEVDTTSVADTSSTPAAESAPAAESTPAVAAEPAREETEKVSPGTKITTQPEISPVKSAGKDEISPVKTDQPTDLELSLSTAAPQRAIGKIAQPITQPETLAGAKLSPAEQIASARILEAGSLGSPMPQTTQGTQTKQASGQTPRRFERIRDIDTPSQMRAPTQNRGGRQGRDAQTQEPLQAQAQQQQQQSQSQSQDQDRPTRTQKKPKSMLGRLGKGAGIAASLGLGGGLLSQATPAAVAATHAHAAGHGIFQTILELILR